MHSCCATLSVANTPLAGSMQHPSLADCLQRPCKAWLPQRRRRRWSSLKLCAQAQQVGRCDGVLYSFQSRPCLNACCNSRSMRSASTRNFCVGSIDDMPSCTPYCCCRNCGISKTWNKRIRTWLSGCWMQRNTPVMIGSKVQLVGHKHLGCCLFCLVL